MVLQGGANLGRAEIIDGGPRLAELMAPIVARNFPGQDEVALAAHVAQMIRKRVVVVVHPEKVISWDHRKLKAG